MHARATTTRAALTLAAGLALATGPVAQATALEAAPDRTTASVTAAAGTASVDYGTWQRDVTAALAGARAHIEARSADAGGEKQAIVLDIDNTSLETHFHPFWKLPTPAVGQVRDLARYADSRGVAVFFVTARPGIIHSLTDWNLKKSGYPVDGLYVRDLPDLFEEVSAYKTEKRAEIEAKGYTIIANIGNNTTDIVGGHAEKAYKLPDYDGQLS
ncbi:HAD family acid phosphatase [Streptomyces sp. t39]|uniref:HAD family acid phosphatase n=1 Tax=Streptomyces sp. t39 TaxID=1828156 RepID=UPI0011CD413F|nr:HAD family acid phosphatase [Streptomyces sp. t39]TXS57606.1 hydrolase [Streptomyces sp. t39]